MPRVIIRHYGSYYDVVTKVQFSPVLDVTTKTYVGVAEVDQETAEKYVDRPGFAVLDSESFSALTTRFPDPEPTEPATGDPLQDAAAKPAKGAKAAQPAVAVDPADSESLPPPPAPPASK